MTHHPFQLAGARAAVAMVGRKDPARLAERHLTDVVGEIVASAAAARVSSVKDGPGWAWRQTLRALYPNSPATHHVARKASTAEFEAGVLALFGPDEDGPWRIAPCWCCQTPTTHRWGKALWPLAGAAGHLNAQPEGGHPACRECRIAVWCLPWGCGSNGHTLTAVECPGSPDVEHRIAAAYVRHNRAVLRRRAGAWPAGSQYGGLLEGIAGAGEVQLTVRVFRNDSKQPFLRERTLTERQVGWLSEMAGSEVHSATLAELCERTGVNAVALAGNGDLLERTIRDFQHRALDGRRKAAVDDRTLAVAAEHLITAYNQRYAADRDPATSAPRPVVI